MMLRASSRDPEAAAVPRVMEAPVFYPTREEWDEDDPLAYIERIRPQAERAGICKIVPPSNWRPPFEVENTKSRFATRTQSTHLLEAGNRVRTLFELKFRKFCFLLGKPLKRPTANHRPDWCALYREVTALGGSATVTAKHAWSTVSVALRTADVFGRMSPVDLKGAFTKHMLEFESHYFYNDGVTFPLNKRLQNRVSPSRMKTRRGALEGLRLGARGREAGERGARIGSEALIMVNKLKEKHTVHHGKRIRRTSEDDEDGTTLLGIGISGPLETLLDMFSVPPEPPRVGDIFWKWFEEDGRCFRGTVVASYKPERGKKRTMWKVHYNGNKKAGGVFEQEEAEDDLALMIACGATPEEATEAFHCGVCQCCNRANLPDTFVSCDDCDWRFHEGCLLEEDRPNQLEGKERSDWFCPMCIERLRKKESSEPASDSAASDEEDLEALVRERAVEVSPVVKAIGMRELAEFGFPDGERFSLEEYIENDKAFRSRYEKNTRRRIFHSEETVEAEFWRIATGKSGEMVEVNYGNDLDTGSTMGSGFPTLERLQRQQRRMERLSSQQRRELEEYATSSWNLTNFPTSRGSLLQHIDASISGVIVPWLYMGMTFSAFCFHVEDHNFASVNYLHRGAPKSWWGVPAEGADAFEGAAEQIAPELFEARPDLLQGIVTHFDPSDMAVRGVPMFHVVQRPGDFIVTFPRAYHGGFNHGFNSAEAVNFAGRAWLAYGPQAVQRYAALRKTPVVAHEALILAIAAWCLKEGNRSSDALRTTLKLIGPLALMVQQEKLARERAEACKKRKVKQMVWRSAQDDTSGTPIVAKRSSSRRNGGMVEASATSGTNRNERTVLLMGRVQKLSAVFNGVPRCTVCKRYCCLSHARAANSNEIRCLDHAPEGSLFFQTYDMATLEDCLTKLNAKVRPALHWMECANRVCQGEKLPPGAFSEPSHGQSAHSAAAYVMPDTGCLPTLMEPLFTKPAQWKQKPSLDVALQLLAMDSAGLVDESSIWQAEVNRATRLCDQVMSIPIPSRPYGNPVCATTAQVDILVAALDGLWFEPPPEVLYHLAELRVCARNLNMVS